MPRNVFNAVNMRYTGQPTLSVAVDGVVSVINQQLPNHAKMLQRRFALPPGMIGYTPQVTSSSFTGSLTYEFEGQPEVAFSTHQLFHFVEVTFSGTVEFSIYVDEVQKKPNNGLSNTLSLTARDSKKQDTRRIYFPPLSFGWIPHIKQIVDSSEDGQIFSSQVRALPARFFKGEREHTEAQITYQGGVNISAYLDGVLAGEFLLKTNDYDTTAYQTVQHYFPAGTRGNVLQWIQTSGDGEVALFETNITLTDQTQPQTEV